MRWVWLGLAIASFVLALAASVSAEGLGWLAFYAIEMLCIWEYYKVRNEERERSGGQ